MRSTMEGRNQTAALLWLSAGVCLAGCAFMLFRHLNERSYSTSKLDALEKGFNLYSEQAFYYSFYSDLIDAESFSEGLRLITRDTRSEYPCTVNALHRFNIYPEVTMAAAYRFGFNRLFPDRFDFMLACVFGLAGFQIFAMFCTVAYVLKSFMCGAMFALVILLNFFEVTRVHNHPMLRETFALPFLWVEIGVLAWNLRLKETTTKSLAALCVVTVAFLIPWQFSQFPLLIQSFAVFLLYCIGYVPAKKMSKIYISQLVAVGITVLAMFLNEMLLTSMFFFFLIAGTLVSLLDPRLGPKTPVVHITIRLFLVISVVAALKAVATFVLRVTDDSHVFLLLWAHLTGYEDFVTLQYLCGQAYNPMPGWVFESLSASFILLFGAIGASLLAVKVATDYADGAKTDPVPPFLLALCSGFFLLGLTMLRMLPFFTPALCLPACTLLVNDSSLVLPWRWAPVTQWEEGAAPIEKQRTKPPKRPGKVGKKNKTSAANLWQWVVQGAVCVAMVLGPLDRFNMFVGGRPTRHDHTEKMALVRWINDNTEPTAVITASLEASAYLKLYTRRPITIHPHAENREMRERYRHQYQTYGRVSERDVFRAMKVLKTDYVVLTGCGVKCSNNNGYDYIASKNGLSDVDMAAPLFCWRAMTEPQSLKYFRLVYNSKNETAVLKVKKTRKEAAQAH